MDQVVGRKKNVGDMLRKGYAEEKAEKTEGCYKLFSVVFATLADKGLLYVDDTNMDRT